MRVVVAGARGFIGAAAMRALASAGHEVLGCGRDEAVPTCDALVWAAGRRERDLDANRAVHVTAAVAAIRAARPAHVIYLSSGEVYGDAPLPYREDGPCSGASAYARAKLEGEEATAAVASVTALRIGVVYGPGQSPNMMIPQLVAALRAGKRFPMTHGEQTRDFVFVADVAEAIAAAVAHPPAGATNIGSGREVPVREAALVISRALGAPDLFDFGAIALRPDEPRRYVLDVARAAQLLGWSARTPFAEGAARL
jgi:nucleoside-diphosphate-sugar epimerase